MINIILYIQYFISFCRYVALVSITALRAMCYAYVIFIMCLCVCVCLCLFVLSPLLFSCTLVMMQMFSHHHVNNSNVRNVNYVIMHAKNVNYILFFYNSVPLKKDFMVNRIIDLGISILFSFKGGKEVYFTVSGMGE